MEGLRVQGRVSSPLSLEVVREITDSDLPLLNEPRLSIVPSVQRLRDSHHALARALATGMADIEAAQVTGYSTSRIACLRMTPAFNELIEHYRSERTLAEADSIARISTLKLDFLEELRERLNEKPESFTNRETLDCFKELADRSGNGPTRQLNVSQLKVTTEDLLKLARGLTDEGVTIVEARAEYRQLASGNADGESVAEIDLAGLEGKGDNISEQGGAASTVDGEVRGTDGGT